MQYNFPPHPRNTVDFTLYGWTSPIFFRGGRLGGPDYVTALKSVKASWSEAIALLAGPAATSVGVSADWAKAAEVTGRNSTGCEGGI